MITNDIVKAIKALQQDQLVAIPTETVYGLAGNAHNDDVVRKIYALKNRPAYNPLIVHIKSASFLPKVAQNIPQLAFDLADRFWPGPLTLLLEKQVHISAAVTAGNPTVAVRVPDHLLTLSLLESLEFPLVAPSANPFGSISPTSAEHVWHYFGDSLGVILDGGHCAK
ncbi:L-threonylcarbamoyladenylate synthase [Flavobacterium lotistagni]|uniref:L-threonylcarbamoyladenylate synthase n=1 Tax=Flavobacterium lotistagni TaxID=2709660 RepID=UPI00293B951E|nr:L-threonylcarbamoyladenylate synthase [Flavobacterium lotistagni]